MKVVVRHEGASEQEVEQTCVWVVGDDGETISTEYLKPGEQVDLTVSGEATIDAEFGTVGPIAAPPEDEEPTPEQPPAPAGNTGDNAGGDGSTQSSGSGGDDSAGAPGVQSGGQAGGSIAE